MCLCLCPPYNLTVYWMYFKIKFQFSKIDNLSNLIWIETKLKTKAVKCQLESDKRANTEINTHLHKITIDPRTRFVWDRISKCRHAKRHGLVDTWTLSAEILMDIWRLRHLILLQSGAESWIIMVLFLFDEKDRNIWIFLHNQTTFSEILKFLCAVI